MKCQHALPCQYRTVLFALRSGECVFGEQGPNARARTGVWRRGDREADSGYTCPTGSRHASFHFFLFFQRCHMAQARLFLYIVSLIGSQVLQEKSPSQVEGMGIWFKHFFEDLSNEDLGHEP